jgi:hypothetical protein
MEISATAKQKWKEKKWKEKKKGCRPQPYTALYASHPTLLAIVQ